MLLRRSRQQAPVAVGERANTVFSLIVVGAVMVAGLTLLDGDLYALRLLSLSGVYAILAIGLRLTFAEVGELNLGHGVLFALGAYGVAIGGTKLGLGQLAGVMLGIGATALLALLVSLLALRLTGAFFAVATLGLIPVATALIVNVDGVTGGVYGLGGYGGGIDNAVPLLGTSGQLAWMAAIWGLTLVVTLLDHWLRASRFGQALNAVRQDPVLFASLGFNVTAYRVAAAVISGGIAGLAGGVYALHEGLVSVSLVGLALLATVIITVVAGGGSAPGGVLAASLLVTSVPEYARGLGDFRLLAFGVFLLVLLKFVPDGAGPFGVRLVVRLVGSRRRVALKPGTAPPLTPSSSSSADPGKG